MLSLQQKITIDIIDAIKNGVKPWSCPWGVKGENLLPINFMTRTHYSGINVPILWLQCYRNGFTSNAWLTFNQVVKLNGRVTKGSKGTLCVFYSLKEVDDEKTGERKQIPIAKPFTVFNLSQIEGIVDDIPLSVEFNPIDKGEEMLQATQAKIQFGGHRAFYRRDTDQISLPRPDAFKSPEDFYATALHELVHWTGHETRLNRQKGKSFGDVDYAFEELVAELGSAFLCGELGLHGTLQHASYIDSWLKILADDSRAIFRAASLASKAHVFIKAFDRSVDDLKVA